MGFHFCCTSSIRHLKDVQACCTFHHRDDCLNVVRTMLESCLDCGGPHRRLLAGRLKEKAGEVENFPPSLLEEIWQHLEALATHHSRIVHCTRWCRCLAASDLQWSWKILKMWAQDCIYWVSICYRYLKKWYLKIIVMQLASVSQELQKLVSRSHKTVKTMVYKEYSNFPIKVVEMTSNSDLNCGEAYILSVHCHSEH